MISMTLIAGIDAGLVEQRGEGAHRVFLRTLTFTDDLGCQLSMVLTARTAHALALPGDPDEVTK